MNGLDRRLAALESKMNPVALPMPFLWGWSQTLDEALSAAGLSLDQDVCAIELIPAGEAPSEQRLSERARLEEVQQ